MPAAAAGWQTHGGHSHNRGPAGLSYLRATPVRIAGKLVEPEAGGGSRRPATDGVDGGAGSGGVGAG